MPDNARDKRVHARRQVGDILSEGESIKPMSKNDKRLYTKREPKSLQQDV